MTRRARRGVLSAAAWLVLVPVASPGAVELERVAYGGWPEAWRIANGEAEVVIVPEVARVMRYALRGGPNVLWADPALAGRRGSREDWLNFGGDKAWLWPQDAWHASKWGGWPPPYECDQAPHRAERTGDAGLRLISPPVAGYGVRVVREFALSPAGSDLTVHTRLEPAGPPGPAAYGAWTVCQVPPADVVLARMVAAPRLERGYKIFGETPWADVSSPAEGWLAFAPPAAGTSSKAGVDADLLAWVGDGWLLVQRQAGGRKDAEWAEPGERAQLFAGAKPPPYMELEFTSPRVAVTGNRSAELTVRWSLARLHEEERSARAIAARLARPEP